MGTELRGDSGALAYEAGASLGCCKRGSEGGGAAAEGEE